MKIVTKVLLASALALAVAPALADDGGMDHRTHASAGKRAPHSMSKSVPDQSRMRRATDSMAFEPAQPFEGYGYRYFHDFGVGSQS